jgi:hypothetical protein
MPTVRGFLPSTSGLHFANAFPSVPLVTARLPGIPVDIAIGNAALGLCGGMVFTVIDYFVTGLRPPADASPPGAGPLFDYLVKRLWDSWDVPAGLWRYWALMNPGLPDSGAAIPFLGSIHSSRSAVMISEEWPRVQHELDSQRLAPVGLVRAKSADPAIMGQNHQILAYGYELNGTNLTLRVYDPNAPDRDDLTLTASLASPHQPCDVECTSVPNVFCFFLSHYTAPHGGPPPGGTPLDAG